MLVIKLCSENKDIRRVTVEKQISLVELAALAKSLFRDALPQNMLFKYTDPDNDEISITCDRELEEAFRLFKDHGVMRLQIVAVKEKAPKTSIPNPVPQQSQNNGKEEEVKSPLDEISEAFFPFLNNLETRFKEVYPKLEEQAQNILPKLESLFPKLDEILPKLDELLPLLEEKLKEAFAEPAQPAADIPKKEAPMESPKPVEEIPVVEVVKPTEAPKAVEVVKPVEIPVESTPFQPSTPKLDRSPSPFEAKLAQLEEMGFTHRPKNIEALVKRKGDMILVVKDLLE